MSLLLLHIFLPLYILLSHAGIELYLPSLQPPQHRRFFRRRRESLQPTLRKLQAYQIHLWYQVPAHEHLQIQRRHHRHNLRVEAAQHAQHPLDQEQIRACSAHILRLMEKKTSLEEAIASATERMHQTESLYEPSQQHLRDLTMKLADNRVG